MGVALSGAPLGPLCLSIDDTDVATTAGFRRALRGRGYPSGTRYTWYALIAGNLIIGAIDLSDHRPVGWLYIVIAALYATMPVLKLGMYGRPNAFVIPLEFTASDAGIAYTLRGKQRPISVSWRAIRSVTNEPDAFVIVMREWLSRPIYVPKSPDASISNELWAMFYAHLVAKRGLHPSSPDRLSVITNTASAHG